LGCGRGAAGVLEGGRGGAAGGCVGSSCRGGRFGDGSGGPAGGGRGLRRARGGGIPLFARLSRFFVGFGSSFSSAVGCLSCQPAATFVSETTPFFILTMSTIASSGSSFLPAIRKWIHLLASRSAVLGAV
jgi:hypothetical protein